jgi:hypothetical protein
MRKKTLKNLKKNLKKIVKNAGNWLTYHNKSDIIVKRIISENMFQT